MDFLAEIVYWVLLVKDFCESIVKKVRRFIKKINILIKRLENFINGVIESINDAFTACDEWISRQIGSFEEAINSVLKTIKRWIDGAIKWVKDIYDRAANKLKIKIIRKTMIKLGTPATSETLSDESLQSMAESIAHPDITSYIPEFNLEVTLPDWSFFGTFSFITLPRIPLPPAINEEEEDYDTYIIELEEAEDEEKEAEDEEKSEGEKAADDAYEAFEKLETATSDLKKAEEKYITAKNDYGVDHEGNETGAGAKVESKKAEEKYNAAKTATKTAKNNLKNNTNDENTEDLQKKYEAAKTAEKDAKANYDKAKQEEKSAKEKYNAAKKEFNRVNDEYEKIEKEFNKADKKAREYKENKNINYEDYENTKPKSYDDQNLNGVAVGDLPANTKKQLEVEVKGKQIKVKQLDEGVKASIAKDEGDANSSGNGDANNGDQQKRTVKDRTLMMIERRKKNRNLANYQYAEGDTEEGELLPNDKTQYIYAVDTDRSGTLQDVNFNIDDINCITENDIRILEIFDDKGLDTHNKICDEIGETWNKVGAPGIYLYIDKNMGSHRIQSMIRDEAGDYIIIKKVASSTNAPVNKRSASAEDCKYTLNTFIKTLLKINKMNNDSKPAKATQSQTE